MQINEGAETRCFEEGNQRNFQGQTNIPANMVSMRTRASGGSSWTGCGSQPG